MTLAAAALSLLALPVQAAGSTTVRVCFDEAAPNVLIYRDANGRLQGAAFTLAEQALQRAGLKPEFVGIPWARCLRELEDFAAQGQFEMALQASRSPEREAKFLFSVPTHMEHGGVWYLRSRYPQGLQLKSRADLARFRVCGIHGGNLQWLSKLGVTQIDQGSRSVRAVMEKLELQRCDAFPLSRESAHLVPPAGPAPIPDTPAFEPYPDRSEFSKHLLVSRGSPRGELIRAKLDQALTELHRSGEADQIFRRYLPAGTGVQGL
jgi:polar amino acid transport system substrate-binding protein